MPHAKPDDDCRKFLGVPGWLWDKILHYGSIAVLMALGYSVNSNLQVNGKHAEKQIEKQDEQIVAVKENTAATEKVEAATQAIPEAAAVAAKVVVEQKEAKGADQ